MRSLKPEIKTFEAFYAQLVAFVQQGKPCFSVLKKKRYNSHLEGSTIVMRGKDRQEPSEYSKEALQQVYQIIKNQPNITTEMLDPAVGRHRSPILALMVGSGVVGIKIEEA